MLQVFLLGNEEVLMSWFYCSALGVSLFFGFIISEEHNKWAQSLWFNCVTLSQWVAFGNGAGIPLASPDNQGKLKTDKICISSVQQISVVKIEWISIFEWLDWINKSMTHSWRQFFWRQSYYCFFFFSWMNLCLERII